MVCLWSTYSALNNFKIQPHDPGLQIPRHRSNPESGGRGRGRGYRLHPRGHFLEMSALDLIRTIEDGDEVIADESDSEEEVNMHVYLWDILKCLLSL